MRSAAKIISRNQYLSSAALQVECVICIGGARCELRTLIHTYAVYKLNSARMPINQYFVVFVCELGSFDCAANIMSRAPQAFYACKTHSAGRIANYCSRTFPLILCGSISVSRFAQALLFLRVINGARGHKSCQLRAVRL